MTDVNPNSLLNDLLIELHRSLIQYVAEAWPWTTQQDAELKQAVERVARRQQTDVAQLVQVLQDRGHTIDFGVYPHEYTSLHYVALEFLFNALKQSQQELTHWIQSLISKFPSDPQAEQIVRDIAASQELGLRELSALALLENSHSMSWMK